MILEICANGFLSAFNAHKAGADRIELCSNLAVGGTTPSYGLLKMVSDRINIPCLPLIRPRGGNFTYTDPEINEMLHDIDLAKELGCIGIVSGVLHLDHKIDIKQTKRLVERAHPLPFVFHRGFDWTPDPKQALETLIDLGVSRILTSGQAPSAAAGIDLIKQLIIWADQRIEILAGGGINADNAQLFKAAGCTQIHASASSLTEVNDIPPISMNGAKFYSETHLGYSDSIKIKGIIDAIQD